MPPLADLRPEEAVLCLAARTVVDPAAAAALEARLTGGLDWERLWRLSHRHEVVPLVTTTLTGLARPDGPWAVPADWVAAAGRRRIATLLKNRAMLGALRDLLSALEVAGVEAMPVKGLVLAGRLYGDLGLRPAGDIDLLVRREQLPAARSVLAELGYRQSVRPSYEERHHAFHDAPYFRTDANGEICVELHWGLAAPAQFRLDIAGAWERSQRVEVFEMPVRVLSDVDTLVHLAVHRTRSALRMRWIVDIAELVQLMPAADWPLALDTARAAGARTALAVALDLSDRLLDAPVPDDVRAHLTISPLKRSLLERTCGVAAMFPAVDRPDDDAQPHLTYRVFEQDGAGRIARSLAATAVRKADKWRDRRRLRTAPPVTD